MSKTYKYILDFSGNNRSLVGAIDQNKAKLTELDRKAADSKRALGETFGGVEKIKSGLLSFAGAAGLAFGTAELVSFTKDLVKLGGEAEGVQAAFNKIADARDLANLRDSVHGTVSDLELMKRAVSAQNFGIPVKELGNLFAFATKRAQDTGQSVDYLVDSIVTGIGRKSPLILDNLGISATALKDKMHGVAIESASVGEITKAVGEIAADSFKKTGDILDTNAIKLQQLAAEWENTKATIANNEVFNEVVSGAVGGLSNGLEVLFSSNLSFVEKLAGLLDFTGAQTSILAEKSRVLKTVLAETNNELKKTNTDKSTVQVKQYDNSFEGLNERLKDYNDQLKKIAPSDQASLQAKLLQINAIEEQIDKVEKLKSALATMAADTSSGFRKDRFQTITTISETKVTGSEKAFDTKAKLDVTDMQKNMPVFLAAQEEMRNQMSATEEMGKAVGQAVGDSFAQFGQRAIESFGLASTGMEGFVGNMLSGITELMGMLLANAIGNAIVSGSLSASFSGPGAVFTLPAFIAAGVASVMGAFAAIPAFADGGIVYGPTMGLMGEYPGARSNPEVIAPLSKLQAMISRSGNDRPIILQPSVDFTGDKMRVMLNSVENKRLKRVGR